jgi:hypothetical protein
LKVVIRRAIAFEREPDLGPGEVESIRAPEDDDNVLPNRSRNRFIAQPASDHDFERRFRRRRAFELGQQLPQVCGRRGESVEASADRSYRDQPSSSRIFEHRFE